MIPTQMHEETVLFRLTSCPPPTPALTTQESWMSRVILTVGPLLFQCPAGWSLLPAHLPQRLPEQRLPSALFYTAQCLQLHREDMQWALGKHTWWEEGPGRGQRCSSLWPCLPKLLESPHMLLSRILQAVVFKMALRVPRWSRDAGTEWRGDVSVRATAGDRCFNGAQDRSCQGFSLITCPLDLLVLSPAHTTPRPPSPSCPTFIH